MKTKMELIALVAALRSCRLRFREIGLILGKTPQRIGQIVVAYRLDPPRFRTPQQIVAWLEAHYPELAGTLREHFKNENESPASPRKGA